MNHNTISTTKGNNTRIHVYANETQLRRASSDSSGNVWGKSWGLLTFANTVIEFNSVMHRFSLVKTRRGSSYDPNLLISEVKECLGIDLVITGDSATFMNPEDETFFTLKYL